MQPGFVAERICAYYNFVKWFYIAAYLVCIVTWLPIPHSPRLGFNQPMQYNKTNLFRKIKVHRYQFFNFYNLVGWSKTMPQHLTSGSYGCARELGVTNEGGEGVFKVVIKSLNFLSISLNESSVSPASSFVEINSERLLNKVMFSLETN
jgi:hypothetical protein